MGLELKSLVIGQGAFRLRADLAVPAGVRCAVIGPSGGGKSTLLGAVAGFVAPLAGRVIWNGDDLTGKAPGDRPISMIFQDNNLFPHLTVGQNVGLGVRHDLKLSADDKSRVAAALERVGLDDMQSRKPAELSGGQIARVALARVAVQARPLLLLDEPFAALGPALKAEMLDLVAEIVDGSGATLLMVSHDPEDAKRIADQTVLVADGVARAPVATGALFDDPPEALEAYLGV